MTKENLNLHLFDTEIRKKRCRNNNTIITKASEIQCKNDKKGKKEKKCVQKNKQTKYISLAFPTQQKHLIHFIV